MFNILLSSNLVVTLGYAFSSVLLLLWFAFAGKKEPILELARLSNGMLAFYALCETLLSIYELVRVGRTTPVGPVAFLIVLLVMVVPAARKKPLWLLLPFSIIINGGKLLEDSDSTRLTKALWRNEPYILFLLACLYLLLLSLLFLFSLWARRLMAEEDPPA